LFDIYTTRNRSERHRIPFTLRKTSFGMMKLVVGRPVFRAKVRDFRMTPVWLPPEFQKTDCVHLDHSPLNGGIGDGHKHVAARDGRNPKHGPPFAGNSCDSVERFHYSLTLTRKTIPPAQAATSSP
jgi:hypothetical protein